MTSRDGQENRFKSRSLIIALTLLILAIIILVISIVVTAVNNNSQSGNAEEEYTLPEELQGDDLSPSDQVIKETTLMSHNPNITNVEIEAYYDEVIDGALKEKDTNFAINIIIQKMNFISVVENDCERAREYIDSVDLSPYSVEEKQYLASYVISMAIECNDQELQAKWNNYYLEMGTTE